MPLNSNKLTFKTKCAVQKLAPKAMSDPTEAQGPFLGPLMQDKASKRTDYDPTSDPSTEALELQKLKSKPLKLIQTPHMRTLNSSKLTMKPLTPTSYLSYEALHFTRTLIRSSNTYLRPLK